MIFSLHLYEKPSVGSYCVADLSRYAETSWRRTSRTLGGFWTGEFSITDQQMSRLKLWEFYHNNIGRLVKERSFGMVTWEGEIYEMTLTVSGSARTITLDPERWHNKVQVQYTYPREEDRNQGVLAYVSPGGNDGFQDQSQDFGDWETLAGNAVYEIIVTNDDATTAQAYLGAAFLTTNPDDSIYCYEDLGLTDEGWNGPTSGKTPLSYVVRHIAQAGVGMETAWSETTDSSDAYGEACYIDVRGEMPTAAAEAIRDRRLAEHAYPKSVPIGGVSDTDVQERREMRLDVLCAGYIYSMNRRYMEVDVEPDSVSDQIALLVDGSADAAEFVTAGTIDSNTTLTPTIPQGNLSQRLWDRCEELIEMGDSSGNRWIGGVYAGRVLNYEQAVTTGYYRWRNGRLCDHGGVPVPATMIPTNIIVIEDDVPYGVPAGSGSAWHNPRQWFVEEVEFIAPRSYRLVPYEGEELFGTY